MITRVEIKNYRSIAHADVTMGPLTVLVGRNGSGKSSFVDALKFVRDALQIGLENAVNARGGFNSIRRFGAPNGEDVEIAIEVDEENFKGRYELALGNGREVWEIRREVGSYGVNSSFERVGEQQISIIPLIPFISSLSNEIERPMPGSNVLVLPMLGVVKNFYRLWHDLDGDFHTQFLEIARKPQMVTNPHRLNDSGDNFLSVLRNITQDEDVKVEIVNALSHITDGVSDIRVSESSSYLIGALQHGDLENAPWFNLEQESDGTLRMLFLLTALYQESSPAERVLLAIEDPEFALHPGALAILSDEIKSASLRRQLLITTQSPDLIARFDAKDLRVVERRAGVTHIAPLEKGQRRVIEDQLFDAGELLRSEGLRGAGGN